MAYNENKQYITLDYWSGNMLNFDSLEKGLEIISPPHFVYDFLRKILSCYIQLTDQFSVSDCLYFLRYCAVCVLHLFVPLLWRHKFWKKNLFNRAVFLHDQVKPRPQSWTLRSHQIRYSFCRVIVWFWHLFIRSSDCG